MRIPTHPSERDFAGYLAEFYVNFCEIKFSLAMRIVSYRAEVTRNGERFGICVAFSLRELEMPNFARRFSAKCRETVKKLRLEMGLA